MHSSKIAMTLAALGLGLAAVAMKSSLDASDRAAEAALSVRDAMHTLAGIEDELQSLRDDLKREVAAPVPEPTRPAAPFDAELERRIAALETAQIERAVTGDSAAVEASEEASDQDDFELLQARVFTGEATPADQARFWEIARKSDVLPKLIRSLEARARDNPQSVDARLLLAQAYVAKLYTVPDGPERGAWAARAEEQWQEVLGLEETNWEARYGLATSLSEWPAMFNKGAEAIRQFETLRQQQELDSPQPHHEQVYFQLAALYRREGKHEKAVDTLRSGAERFPTSDSLRAALESAR